MRVLDRVVALAAGVLISSGAIAQEPIRIGLVAPFSGNYAIFSEGYTRGIDTWKEMYGSPKVNGRPIEIVNIDERCDVNTGLAAYRREIGNLIATIGPSCSGVVKAIMPLADAGKKPTLFLGHGAALTMGRPAGGYAFRLTQPDELNLRAFGDFILKKWKAEGKTRIAAIHDTTVTFSQTGAVLKKVAADIGVEIVAAETFDLGNKDFTGQLLKIRQSNAQALVMVTYAADEARLVRQIAELKLGIPVAGGVDTPYLATVEKDLVEGATQVLDGLYFYSDYIQGEKATEVQKFNEAFHKKYNMPALDIDYEGWLAMALLHKALQQPGSDSSGEQLRAALQNTQLDLGGRTVSFTENGDQAMLVTYIGQINRGVPELVDVNTRPRSDFPLK